MHTVSEYCCVIDQKLPLSLRQIPSALKKDYEFSNPVKRQYNDRNYKPELYERIREYRSPPLFRKVI